MSEEELYNDYIPLPPAYGIPLLILNTLSSCLSILGSSAILYMSTRKNNFFQQILQRLMFFISLSDVGLSLSLMIMPFVLPSDQLEDVEYAAFGNPTTCRAFGFLLSTFVWTSCCYNCFLSLYFLATVRYQWKEPTSESTSNSFGRCGFNNKTPIPCWEIGTHIAILLVPFVLISVGLGYDVIHPHSLAPVCYFSTGPLNDGGTEDIIPTTETNKTTVVFSLIGIAAFLLGMVNLLSIGATFLLYWTVRQKMKQSSNFRSKSMMTGAASHTSLNGDNSARQGRVRSQSVTQQSNDDDIQTAASAAARIAAATRASLARASSAVSSLRITNRSSIQSTSDSDEDDPFLNRILQVRTQAILYALVYCNSVIWFLLEVGITMVMDKEELQQQKTSPGLYTLQILAVTFAPLVGFCNFFVYIRPKVLRWKSVTEGEESLWWIGTQILMGTEIPTSAAARRRQKQQHELLAKNNLKKEPEMTTTITTQPIPSATSTFRESTLLMHESIASPDQVSCLTITGMADSIEDGLSVSSGQAPVVEHRLPKAASLPVLVGELPSQDELSTKAASVPTLLQQQTSIPDEDNPKSQQYTGVGLPSSQDELSTKAASVPALLQQQTSLPEDSKS